MGTPRTQHQSTQRLRHPKPDLVRLWVLRLLVPLGGQQPFIVSVKSAASVFSRPDLS